MYMYVHYITQRHGKGTMVWPDQSKYIVSSLKCYWSIVCMTKSCILIGCCQGDWVDDERHGEGQFTFNTREVYDGKWMEDRICE